MFPRLRVSVAMWQCGIYLWSCCSWCHFYPRQIPLPPSMVDNGPRRLSGLCCASDGPPPSSGPGASASASNRKARGRRPSFKRSHWHKAKWCRPIRTIPQGVSSPRNLSTMEVGWRHVQFRFHVLMFPPPLSQGFSAFVQSRRWHPTALVDSHEAGSIYT